MAAYMIVYAAIKDRDKFIQGYAPAAAKLVAEHGGKYIVRAGGAEVLAYNSFTVNLHEQRRADRNTAVPGGGFFMAVQCLATYRRMGERFNTNRITTA